MPDSRSSLSQKPGIRRGFSAAMTAWSLLYHDSKTMLILSCLAVRNNSWPDFLAGYGQGVLHFSSKHSVPSAEGGRWWERTDLGGFYYMLFGQLLFFISYLSNIINIFIYSEDSYMLSTSIHYSSVYAILELREFLRWISWIRGWGRLKLRNVLIAMPIGRLGSSRRRSRTMVLDGFVHEMVLDEWKKGHSMDWWSIPFFRETLMETSDFHQQPVRWPGFFGHCWPGSCSHVTLLL